MSRSTPAGITTRVRSSRRAVLKVLGASSVASLSVPACGGYDGPTPQPAKPGVFFTDAERRALGGLANHVVALVMQDPKTSVCDPVGKFHGLENLYASDGSLFPTSSGYNPTHTIVSIATRVAGNMVFPGSPERVLA